MKNSHIFLTNFVLSAVRYVLIFAVSAVLLVVGAIWFDICLYIGLGVLVLYLAVCLISAARMLRIMTCMSGDDPEFNEFMANLKEDPMNFLGEIIGANEENRNKHGEELLSLSDDEIFDTVYFQNLEIAGEAEDEEKELEQFSPARATVYVLSLFDAEIQNGGLCQFFTNSTKMLAPLVSQCLSEIGAEEHKRLFDSFIEENNIDVEDLESFRAKNHRQFVKQSKRFDFESFDNKYYELPPIQTKIAEYIRNNIKEF